MPELPAEARVAPWATDDALVSAHAWSAARWAASIWPFWAALGFWAALVAYVLVVPPPHLTADKLLALTAGYWRSSSRCSGSSCTWPRGGS